MRTMTNVRPRLAEACLELLRIPSVTGDEAAITKHLEAWALGQTLDLVTEAQRVRPTLQAAVAINRVRPGTVLGRSARPIPTCSGPTAAG